MRNILPTALLSLTLAACVGPPAAAPVQPVRPAPVAPPAPAPQPTGDWTVRPLSPGDWSYRPEQGGSVALFGSAAGAATLSFRCQLATHRIIISRQGAMVPASGQMLIRTSFGTLQWPAASDAAAPSHTVQPDSVAIRGAGDAGLDQVAFSRGRFAVEIAGLPMLVVPAWPEVARVIEDCRG
jgi:hypothetical protein